jgi:hypothetical protein
MYILSTIIFVIHKVFYEAKNGQTKGSKGQIARDFDAGAGFARGKQRNQRSDTPCKTEQIRLDTESVAFRCRE